jgi:hypothetical protein
LARWRRVLSLRPIRLDMRRAYDKAKRALDEHERVVAELRSRAGTLIAAAAITTSFLGGRILSKPSSPPVGMGSDRLLRIRWAPTIATRSSCAPRSSSPTNLGLRTVAEGIEDAFTFERMRVLGCELAQGFHMSKPLPASGLLRW